MTPKLRISSDRMSFSIAWIKLYNKYLTSVTCRLILVDQDWVPRAPNSSLYIRPTMIGTEIIIIIISIIIIIIIMTGTEPTLGLGPANQATLFVILSPVGSYFGGHSRSVTLLCDPR